MDGFKSIFQSKTFWGGAIAVAAGIGGFFGLVLSPDDQAALVEVCMALGASAGGALAIYGRVKASKKIGDIEE